MSENKNDNNQFARNLGLTLGGTALGAGAGYGATRLMDKLYGERLRRLDPKQRLKVIVPLLAASGTAATFAHTMREDAKRRKEKSMKKQAFYLVLDACKNRYDD